MEYIERELNSVVRELSDQNYDRSLDFYRLWSDIGHAHTKIQLTRTFNDIWNNRGSDAVNPKEGQLFHPTAHLVLRFARDLESDRVLGPLIAGLESRLCERVLQNFFEQGMIGAWQNGGKRDKWGNAWETPQAESTHRIFALDSNLIAQ